MHLGFSLWFKDDTMSSSVIARRIENMCAADAVTANKSPSVDSLFDAVEKCIQYKEYSVTRSMRGKNSLRRIYKFQISVSFPGVMKTRESPWNFSPQSWTKKGMYFDSGILSATYLNIFPLNINYGLANHFLHSCLFISGPNEIQIYSDVLYFY